MLRLFCRVSILIKIFQHYIKSFRTCFKKLFMMSTKEWHSNWLLSIKLFLCKFCIHLRGLLTISWKLQMFFDWPENPLHSSRLLLAAKQKITDNMGLQCDVLDKIYILVKELPEMKMILSSISQYFSVIMSHVLKREDTRGEVQVFLHEIACFFITPTAHK